MYITKCKFNIYITCNEFLDLYNIIFLNIN